MTFTLDTSGTVGPDLKAGLLFDFQWSYLSPFAQGYIAALFESRWLERDEDMPIVLGFSDLSPEALALILADCADASVPSVGMALNLGGDPSSGAKFWSLRQSGQLAPFPPLRVYLDAGKVQIAPSNAERSA